MRALVLIPALLMAAPAAADVWRIEASGPGCHASLTCQDRTLSFNYDDGTGAFSQVAWDMTYADSRGWVFRDVKYADSPVLDGLMDENANDGVILEAIQGAALRFDYVFYSTAGQDYYGAPAGAPADAPDPVGAFSHYQQGAPIYAWGAALDWDPAMTLDDGEGQLAFYVRWTDGSNLLGSYFGIGGTATATLVESPVSDVPVPAAGGLLAAALAGFAALRRRR
ncbi:VPLPA-CTERM sorting domain-containing protein [Rhodovulum sp. DZ06]|uniref:VPLPA-CTERM sorting domain-containing protein n=1 Tax=Rhodovulum sp. DZ06 TaxID=3425126 RepID=UPI003D33B4E6